MAVVLTNNATSLLAAAIDAGATTLSVLTADAGRFPNPAAGDWFPLTLVDNAGNMEIVKATGRAGAIITVERGKEGTTAKAFAAGARVDLRATAAALYDVGEKATTKTVGAAIAGANGKETPADGDAFTGVEAGSSTMFKTTWANIKAALSSVFLLRSGGAMSGPLSLPPMDPVAISFPSAGAYPTYHFGVSGAGNVGLWNHTNQNWVIRYNKSADTILLAANTTVSGSMTVSGGISGTASWANGANYADRLGSGGWTLATVQDQLNWRVTDARFSGYIQNDMYTTGTRTTGLGGASGYVMCDITKNAVESCTRVYRQPQIYIPNVGWRALGGW